MLEKSRDIDYRESLFMKNKVIEAIEREKLIVIVRGVEKDKLLPLAEALYKGGIRLILSELKYSNSYVCHIFKRHMGITLSDYIKNVRLDHVAYYLKTTEYSLKEICDLVGIESLSYANKIFKEKYKTTPIAYRKNNI